MASDLSSGCAEAIGVFDEKEEGEISLEDVSSSEEGHVNYGYGTRIPQCSNCLSSQHNSTWCTVSTKLYHPKNSNRREVDLILQDAVKGKENRHQIKESGCTGTKHSVSTLQEKNDDLVPISSDSDMEIVGLADNSKQLVIHNIPKTKVKKKRRKKRNHSSAITVDDLVSSSVDENVTECVSTLKHDTVKNNSSRSHHREISPVHRNSRSRIVSRSPPRRHRSLIRTRSPFRRSKSPIIRARSPAIKRSPRRLKSPKRSPYRSPTKTMLRKISHFESPSHNYVETHKLLKKVRQLDSIGTHSIEETLNKNKEHASSLKEKLTNMMKGVSDNSSDTTNSFKEKSSVHICKKESNDIDDEEDLALLRQKALETKQKKSNKGNDQSKTETAKQANVNMDDQDEEDLELRMIALRSAVLKKHQNRVQRGMKSGKYKKMNVTRSESPFTQSFLDSIPIPGEKLLTFASPPHTPLPSNENNHEEDMDLDTDVEREKEELPYSPTDKITTNISMDTELLGIQPSDVSFISLNEANNSPGFASMMSNQDDQKSYHGKIIQNHSYLPSLYYPQQRNPLYVPPNTNMQYPLTNTTETTKTDFIKVHNSHANVQHYENTCNDLKDNNNSGLVDVNSSQEIPYSPTDTPVYDPDLSHALSQNIGPIVTSNSSLLSAESSHSSNVQGNIQPVITTNEIKDTSDENKIVTAYTDGVTSSATASVAESVSPSSSMITIDDLPETDADASSLTDSVKNMKVAEHIPCNTSDDGKEVTLEPLYMKGVPDVTKDVNKIPTLINRTLVPAPILKTNKQLQQPLPVKKVEKLSAPTFRSAEMQPVVLDEETNSKSNSTFKPMKLMPFTQKPNSVLILPTAFHDSSHEDLIVNTNANENTSLEINEATTLVQNEAVTNAESPDKVCNNVLPSQKKKKLAKKGLKRKSNGSIQMNTKKCNTMCTNNDNVSTVDTNEMIEDGKEKAEDLEKYTSNQDTSDTPANNVNEDDTVLEETNKQETQIKDDSPNDAMEQGKNSEDRRESLDEDEEALRAILLASLPKRTKPTDSTSNSTAHMPVNTILNSSKQVSVNQTITKDTPSTETVSNTNSTTSVSSPCTNSYESENDKNQSNSEKKINNAIVKTNLPTVANKTSSSITSGRKRLIPITKGPQKKVVKKVPIPASTKVVNNAKKYQNAMMQKKLNLQKAAIYSNQKITESKHISNVQSNDNIWSTTSKTSAQLDTQRIVINLESDTESDSEPERQKSKIVSTNSAAIDKNSVTVNPTAEFEKNLDQFLRDVRKKQESMAAARPTSLAQLLKKDTAQVEKQAMTNLHTPLAVRHLPASQQEEYRRLKQQILEREKLKLHRTIENNISPKNKNIDASSKVVSSNSPIRELQSKLNQSVAPKSPSTNAKQLNKENCSKNLDSMQNTSISSMNNEPNINKANVDMQERLELNSLNITPKPIMNLNIRVCNENSANTAVNKVPGNTVYLNSTRNVFETSAHEVSPKTKTSSMLKILSTEEVNRKFVRIQLKNGTNERVMIINNIPTPDKMVTAQNENISENKESVNVDACDNDMNQIIESVEKEISMIDNQSNNHDIDSDASTIILSRGRNQNIERREDDDTSESTIRLSQIQDDSQTPISIMESKEGSMSPLLRSSMSLGDRKSIEEDWEEIKRDVKTELSGLVNLPRVEQEQRLIDTEQKLVMQRYTILDELAEMSGNLRQWHMERDLQMTLVTEVRKLREQLKVAEERLQMQRNRISSIGPKVVSAHGKINAGRQECFKLAQICSTLGSKIVGNDYKVPEAGAQLLDSRLKEVAIHTRELSRKKVPSIDIPEVHEPFKADEKISIVCTEISQTEESVSRDNVDNIITPISNENECGTKLSDAEETLSVEITTIDLNKMDEYHENSIVMSNDDEKLMPSEREKEVEILTEQRDSNDAPISSTSTPVSRISRDNKQTGASENTISRPVSILGGYYTKKTIVPYESILTHFKTPRNTNPNGVLCPYELMGTCSDGECQFVHQTERQAK